MKPKVAAYPFTTLHPTIGTVTLKDFSEFTMADMPGLIEGASANVGLGHDFLRHIERTKFLIMVLDISGMEGIGVQEMEDGTLKYEFLDPKLNPPPDLEINTPKVDEKSRLESIRREYSKINYQNLMSDYGFKEKDLEKLNIDVPIYQVDDIEQVDNNKFTPKSIDEEIEKIESKKEEETEDLNEYDEGYNEYEEELENEIKEMDEYASHVRRKKENMYLVQPWDVMDKLNKELDTYIPGLSKRVVCIVANKVDIPGASKNLEILKKKTNLPIFPICALNNENIEPLLLFLKNHLIEEKNKETEIKF